MLPGKPVNFIVVANRSMGEKLLTGSRVVSQNHANTSDDK